MSAPVTPAFQRTAAEGEPATKLVTSAVRTQASCLAEQATTARLVTEFAEFPHRVAQLGVRGTYLFFGSARAMSGRITPR